MNVWRIAVKEIKSFRDIRMLVFMVGTPLLFILILGTVFTNAFGGSAKVGEIRVLFVNESRDAGLNESWSRFVQEMKQTGVSLEETEDSASGKLAVSRGQYAGLVEIADDRIAFHGNSRDPAEGYLANRLLATFADRYKLEKGAAGMALSVTEPAASDQDMAVIETSLDGASQPGAMDYYAVAVTTMIILYSSLSAGLLMDKERKGKTSVRLLAAPVTKAEIFAGKIIGTMALNVLFIGIIVLISKMMFGVNWGDRPGLVFLVLISEIAFALSLGLGLSYVLKGEASNVVLMIIIQFAAFFGGSYFPVEQDGGFMSAVASYSPLQWSNDAILRIIYSDDGAAALQAMLLNGGTAIFMLLLAGVMMRKREGL
ncbi:ABC transporter permease [Paenibacillaceae bacterium WGS1546]|uniref:ABC transporter permease n=1 Tax=Cohnella sp. WGS1546 TaxID=3366810 RepID=UPI00372D0A83